MEPISAHPTKLREQISDNKAIIEDLDIKIGSIEALKSTSNDLIKQAGIEDENSKGSSFQPKRMKSKDLFLFNFIFFIRFQDSETVWNVLIHAWVM